MAWALKALIGIVALFAGLVVVQQSRNSVSGSFAEKPTGALRLATWNVHYVILNQPEGRWGLSGWEERKGVMSSVFGMLDADIVAFQEMESFSRGSDGSVNLARDWLLENHTEFAAAAKGPWQNFPPTQPIFYRTRILAPRDEGWFFFSDTPDRLYARGFDGATPSFASWVEFEHLESGKFFRVLNVHPDAKSRTNRRAAAKLIAERVRPWIDAGESVLLAGDLNALHGSFTHRTIAEAGLNLPKVPGSTFHFGRGIHLFGAIDHIGGSEQVQPLGRPQVLRRAVDGVFASDHHPVVLDVVFADARMK